MGIRIGTGTGGILGIRMFARLNGVSVVQLGFGIVGNGLSSNPRKRRFKVSLRLVFSSSDSRVLDASVMDLLDVLRNNKVAFSGPIPLPTSLTRFRSSPSDVVHRRMLDLEVVKCPECIEKMNIPIGVSVKAKCV